MKILYAIQGTGNGHLSRARDVVPCLMNHGEVDLLVSGVQSDLTLPYPIKYKFQGLSFIFGKHGGVDLWKTFVRSSMRKLVREIKSLPITNYDLVINDFEPVSAWACYNNNIPCIGLSHQGAVLAEGTPTPQQTDMMGQFILRNYAPVTTQYGFHFESYAKNVFTPVIRAQVREQAPVEGGHYTVYLPSYDDKSLLDRLSRFKNIHWEVFSKHSRRDYRKGRIHIQPIDNDKFVKSMAGSRGVLCGAGFETPAEALFMRKKLMVIPMKNQYEQQLNAAALKQMGVPVIPSLKQKFDMDIASWLENDRVVKVSYPDRTAEIVDYVVNKHRPLSGFQGVRQVG